MHLFCQTDGSLNPETVFNVNPSQRSQSKRYITAEWFQCDGGASGLYPHPLECTKYLHCDRGKTFVVDCSPGTVFNDVDNVCDWPWKTHCGTRQLNVDTATPIPPISSNSQTTEEEPFRGEGLINIRHGRVASHPQTTDWDPQEYDSFISETISHLDRPKRQVAEPIKCENGVSGLFPHPSDCSKFLQCDRGRTFIMNCFAGTVFDDVAKTCDWPRKTNCGTRKGNNNGAAHPSARPTSSLPSSQERFRGEGLVIARDLVPQAYESVPNQQNYPHQHQHHHRHHQPRYHQQSQNRNDQQPWSSPYLIRDQSHNQANSPSGRPEQNSGQHRIVFMPPNEFAPSQTNSLNAILTRASVYDQPRVEIVNIQNEFPEVNVMSRRVGDEFLKYFSKQNSKTHSKSTEKVHKRPVILKITPQQFLNTNLVSGRVGKEFNVYFVNPKSAPVVNWRLSPTEEIQTKQKPAPIDYITLVRQGTPCVHAASQQFPQINLMSPTVGNEFYRYFSHVKPKSTPIKLAAENPQTTDANVSVPPVVETDEQPTKKDEHGSQASPGKGLFHGQPELNQKISSPLDNYNRLYYKPTKKPFTQNANERTDGTVNVLISDNLKQLLRPYYIGNASKATNRLKSADTAVVLPSNRADVETFTTTPRSRPPFRPQSRFPEPPTLPTPPSYHRSGQYDPNKIYFPGPHSQSHPMHY